MQLTAGIDEALTIASEDYIGLSSIRVVTNTLAIGTIDFKQGANVVKSVVFSGATTYPFKGLRSLN
jgi:hypothetical protein